MPPGQAELQLFTRLVIARMEIERLHFCDQHDGEGMRLQGFADCFEAFRVTLQGIIDEVGC